MKKLMIALGAVAMATCVHAASYAWSGSDIYECWADASSENYAGGMVYLFVEGVNGVTYGDLSTAVSGGKFTSGSWDGKAVSSAAIGTNTGAFSGSYETTTDYEGVNMYAVVLANSYYDGDSTSTATPIDPAQAYLTSAVAAGAQPALGSALVKFGSLEDTWDPSGWIAQGGGSAVPEPTSGLLVLLGVAGLALRRRRA